MLPIAGLLAGESTLSRVATWLALALALAGGVEMFLFRGPAGGFRMTSPTRSSRRVWPLWAGEPIPWWRFERAILPQPHGARRAGLGRRLGPRWQGIQFLPLLLFQARHDRSLAIGLDGQRRALPRRSRRTDAERRPQAPASNLGIDQQQEGRGDRQERRMLRPRRIERAQMRGQDSCREAA